MLRTNVAQLWEQTLRLLESDLPSHSLDTWLKTTRPLSFADRTLKLGVPNTFTKNWIESRYLSLMIDKMQSVLGYPAGIQLQVTELEHHLPRPSRIEDVVSTSLNPRYTFNSFVVGNNNRFAHAASLAVAESPARAYNPLFIYGGVGLGKTHLMQAIGNHILQQMPALRVVYVSSETFTNGLINSIRDDTTAEFRSRYRSSDVLLIDDIQFVAGKERTQEEFFHTFNSLHEANKQVVISSDRPPKEIPTLEERLRSRFEWGLITDIQPPDLETRIAILLKKSQSEKLEIPSDVTQYIAGNISSNIRELEGALTRLVAFSKMKEEPISMELAVEALKTILPETKSRPITIPFIQEVVAAYFGLKIDDLKAKKRTREVTFPRQIAMFLCRELTDLSLPKIGEAFGGRDHTTVMHSYDKVSSDLETDESLQPLLDELTSRLRAG